MPARFSFELIHHPDTPPPFADLRQTGIGLHAALLGAIRKVDPGASASLHDVSPAAFSIEVLAPDTASGQFRTACVILPDPLIASCLVAFSDLRDLRLGRAQFTVDSFEVEERSWSAMAATAQPVSRWTVSFRTPTVRRGPRRLDPGTGLLFEPQLPESAATWTNALTRWEAFAPVETVPVAAERIIQNWLFVDHVESLCTEPHPVAVAKAADGSRRPVIIDGIVGTCTYAVDKRAEATSAELAALDSVMRFADLVGVGDYTSTGMGQLEVLGQRKQRANRR